MSAWGVGIFEDDTAVDARRIFLEGLDIGLTPTAAADRVLEEMEEHAHDDEAVRRIGVETATQMCLDLLARRVMGIHFYCLNRVPSVREGRLSTMVSSYYYEWATLAPLEHWLPEFERLLGGVRAKDLDHESELRARSAWLIC